METAIRSESSVRFESFELNLRTGELYRNGLRLKLRGRPIDVLAILLEHPGELVTRETLQKRLWPDNTFVDFEQILNNSVGKLRDALGDQADSPKFIETLPRLGYRFIAPVESPSPDPSPAENGRISKAATAARFLRRHWIIAEAAGAVLAIVTILYALNAAGLRDRIFGKTASPHIESIAVLPLTNLSGDPQQEYFADGMTESLIAELSQIGSLKVISRTSAMHYKGTNKTAPQIARELHVDGLVEGSVLRSGTRVRINAQLIGAAADTHIWARSYERNLSEVLTLQSEVAQSIANEIRIRVTPQEQTRLASARTVDPEAYELYLKGRYEWNKRTEGGLNKSLEYFQQAINLDPTYALAYSGLADGYSILAENGYISGSEFFPQAKAAALKAVELDNRLAEAHVSLAFVSFQYDRDPAAALKEYETAITLSPNYATAHHWYAMTLARMGRSEEAIREIEQARRLDPLSTRINANVAFVLYFARQYDRGIVEAQKAIDLEPNDPAAHEYLGYIYLQKAMYREALVEFKKVESLGHLEYKPWVDGMGRLHALAAMGNREGALKELKALKRESMHKYISPGRIALCYAALGEKEEAFAWLQKRLDDYDGPMMYMKVDPLFDPLRSDPRFQDLMRRMDLPQ